MSKKKYYKKAKSAVSPSKSTVEVPKSTKRPWRILLGLAILTVVAVFAIRFTDTKGYFLTEQKNRHVEHRWESLYRMCPSDTIDVVVLGNSHVNTGINPKNLSCALGCTAFDLAPHGTRIADAYYSLKELLTITHPKVVVIETYLVRNSDTRKIDPKSMSAFYREFGANRNFPIKMQHLWNLYAPEYWLPAFSTTLRNHEMLFRSRDEIKDNIKLVKKLRRHPDTSLYLGRFVRFTEGISDSVMHLYDSLGASVDGNLEFVSPQDAMYVRKVVELCQRNDIVPMFLTVPMYCRHVKNYDTWRSRLADVIEPMGVPWYDMQACYDTAVFSRDCFESTYDANQHSTYNGSIIFTYRLAQYIKDSLKADLPDRTLSDRWRNLFYGEEGWFENYSPRKGDAEHLIVASDTNINGLHIIDFIYSTKDSVILVKTSPTSAKKLDFYADAIWDGKKSRILLTVSRYAPYDFSKRVLFKAKVIAKLDIQSITGLKYEEK